MDSLFQELRICLDFLCKPSLGVYIFLSVNLYLLFFILALMLGSFQSLMSIKTSGLNILFVIFMLLILYLYDLDSFLIHNSLQLSFFSFSDTKYVSPHYDYVSHIFIFCLISFILINHFFS